VLGPGWNSELVTGVSDATVCPCPPPPHAPTLQPSLPSSQSVRASLLASPRASLAPRPPQLLLAPPQASPLAPPPVRPSTCSWTEPVLVDVGCLLRDTVVWLSGAACLAVLLRPVHGWSPVLVIVARLLRGTPVCPSHAAGGTLVQSASTTAAAALDTVV
jgi:hypothetical protein